MVLRQLLRDSAFFHQDREGLNAIHFGVKDPTVFSDPRAEDDFVILGDREVKRRLFHDKSLSPELSGLSAKAWSKPTGASSSLRPWKDRELEAYLFRPGYVGNRQGRLIS